jgi:hypothetical protein
VSVIAGQIVDWSALLKVVLASFIVGTGVSIAFSLAVLGATRFADHRRDQRQVEATAFAVLGVLGVVACAAAVVFGVVVMTKK